MGTRMGMAVQVSDLVVERGGPSVLRGLSCGVLQGKVTGLLGPSGGGKTTLMRCLVGVQQVRSGSVTVLGRSAGDAALRRIVGYVTQAPSVYSDLSIWDNCRYFAAVAQCENPSGRVDEVLNTVGLADRRRDRVDQLSGGQRARASLACALVGAPQLLVLDEPTVGLDPQLRRDLWNLFHELAGDGATVIVSSHVMDEAARCDRLLLLRDGDLIADDAPSAIRDRTGTDDLEEAFLRLVERQTAAS